MGSLGMFLGMGSLGMLLGMGSLGMLLGMGSLDMLLPWHGITGHAPWHVPPRDNAAYVDFISVWKIGEAWLVEAPGPALEGAACLAGAVYPRHPHWKDRWGVAA
eukprot:1156212-Pelagomonas_calceolata.AAC.4